MMKLFRGSGLLMLALLVGASTAFAAKESQGVLRVEDKAKLFSAEGIRKAEDKFKDVTFKAKTHWTVVTMNDVPTSKKADLEAIGKNEKDKALRFFSDLAKSMAKERNELGVFTLVYTNGDKLIVKTVTDQASELPRHFTDDDAKTLSDKLLDAIRAAKKKSGDEAVTERDGGLLAGTSFVIDQLKDTSLPEAKKTTGSGVSKANNDVKASTGMSIGNWICIGLVAALSIWVLIALVRAFTNRGGGGGGYGGGGYGGGGGGGGGMGFMGSFMTGMLGAAAGMWMYNSFMGGNHYGNDMSAGGAGGVDGGGDTGGVDTGEGNFNGGADGGGGDWGGDTGGGGDAGGGGDWGGGGDTGGDTGGGGDWGGGGGDAGGGDFGGGGGGGDW